MAWQMPTDLTNETTGLMQGTAIWAYNVTYGLYWSMMLLAFCIVLFISTSRYNTARALGFASFAGMMGAIILLTLKLMSWWIASIYILVGVGGIVLMIMSRQ